MLTYIIGLVVVVVIVLILISMRYGYARVDVEFAFLISIFTSILITLFFIFLANLYFKPSIGGQYPEDYARYKENRYTLVDYANLGDQDLITDEVREKATALDEENRVLLRELNEKLEKSEVLAEYKDAKLRVIKLGISFGFLIGFGLLVNTSETALRAETKEKLYETLQK